MQRFDCLSPECPLFGPHLLEASAGTGKTFSIEHIFVRLLLEKVPLEQILAVTFTRAATRELKKRIRDHLQKAVQSLELNQAPWGYLEKYLGSSDSISSLQLALETFDYCQIFTIHSFCYRMLSEFAFEAHLGFSIPHPDQGQTVPLSIRQALKRFWKEDLNEELLCPEQIAKLMKKNGSMKELSDKLLKLERKENKSSSFADLSQRWKTICSQYEGEWIEEEKLEADFLQLSQNYKKVKGDHLSQIKALAAQDFCKMIREEGTLFSFIDPQNQKVRIKPIERLHYPRFFDWGRAHLLPLIEEASDPKKIFDTLSRKWMEIVDVICKEENYFQPDELLEQMNRAIADASLAARLSNKYSAVIIDEFQDTDPTQWEIFRKLFLDKDPPLRALYLVGDPKQSIYRFRKADVYTYFAARDWIGEKNLYHLDTNFRSTKPLIDAMNVLFDRNWLSLPKPQSHIPYHPVRAGITSQPPISDNRGAIHWVHVKPLYMADSLLKYSVLEIERLYPQFSKFSSFAILVKDRYQAQEALSLLQKRNIPAKTRSHLPLGKTDAFRAIQELLEAVVSPQDAAKKRAVVLGPFSILGEELPFAYWKTLIEEEGLVSFAKEVLTDRLPFYADARQIFEELFRWEQNEGYSSLGLQNFLEAFKELDADEGGRRRIEDNEDAVQILTIHISKGLEFEVVFAWGLAFSAKESDEEIDAEKLRQLYVAMTRAKHRLYVPLISEGASPMALFCKQIESQEGPAASYFQKLNQTFSIGYEEIEETIVEPEPKIWLPEKRERKVIIAPPAVEPCYLQSFTSLSTQTHRHLEYEIGDALPLGSETGVVIHEIFESIFSPSHSLWKNNDAILGLVRQKVAHSNLSKWEKPIYELILKTLDLLLPGNFSLRSLSPNDVFPEMEFFFHRPPHFVKGFIDLVFCRDGVYYLADWKTNYLGSQTMEEVMDAHDYWLQASLYSDALKRHLDGKPFGGAFYFFIREGTFLHIEEPHGN